MKQDQAIDENDPDVIAANPPVKAIDPKQHFRTGANEGKWLEYDERGVPIKNMKKKKPTKKEKDQLESEFLDAKKKYQQYLKDVEDWEQKKIDAENGLEAIDRLRWAFRQVNIKLCEEKNTPLAIDQLEEFFSLMGWEQLTKKEITVAKKSARDPECGGDPINIETMRKFTKEVLPIKLLEERLKAAVIEEINVVEVYSPRTWRGKLDGSKKKASSKSPGGSKSPRGGGAKSPRGGGAKSPRGGGGGSSPRGKVNKSSSAKSIDTTPTRSDGASARDGKSPRGASSPRASGKAKKK